MYKRLIFKITIMKKILLISLLFSLLTTSCIKEKKDALIEKKEDIKKEEPKDIEVTEVKLNENELRLTIGDIKTIKANVIPEDAYNKNVVWSSSNETIASIDYGQITAIKEGETTISVKTIDGDKTATCKVIINAQTIEIANITISETSISIPIEKTYTLTYNISPANATDKTVVWKSSDENIATVIDGHIIAKSIGIATITVSSVKGNVNSNCRVNVTKLDKFGTFTDSRDNKIYKTVKIGNQIWLAENLAYLPQVNKINEGGKTGKYYYVYGYNGSDATQAKQSSSYKKYGVLYNWEAAIASCPEGWHLASDQEWKTLEMEMGMTLEDADKYNERGSIAGKLKDASAWSGTINSNESGFSAIPAGYLFYYKEGWECDSEFMLRGRNTKFWTSTPFETDINKAYLRFLSDNDITYRRKTDKDQGYSVRCIKNNN